MSASRWLMLVALLSALGEASAAPVEHTINASEIGTGVQRALNWNNESAETPVWCGTACSYLEVSTAKVAPDVLFTYNPTPWPGSYVTSIPNVAGVVRPGVSTPVGTTDSSNRPIVYESTTYERGAVDLFHGSQALNTKVYQSGSEPSPQPGAAAAAVAYHVKVQNQSTGGRDYFIHFTAPNSTGGISVPTYIGGPSGNQPFNVNQKKYAKSESTVDVLVNGLPVWSTASSYMIPDETTSSTDYSGFAVDFGYASDNDSYTIFVGRFASAEIFAIDFIVRAESLARAPECGKVTEPATWPNPRVLMHCFMITEGRDLPMTSNQQEHFEIYSKVVSTAIIQVLPGPLPVGPVSTVTISSGVQ